MEDEPPLRSVGPHDERAVPLDAQPKLRVVVEANNLRDREARLVVVAQLAGLQLVGHVAREGPDAGLRQTRVVADPVEEQGGFEAGRSGRGGVGFGQAFK